MVRPTNALLVVCMPLIELNRGREEDKDSKKEAVLSLSSLTKLNGLPYRSMTFVCVSYNEGILELQNLS